MKGPITTLTNLRIKPSKRNPSNGFYPPQLTTAQRNAISTSPENAGCIIYNTSVGTDQALINNKWVDIASSTGSAYVTGPAVATNNAVVTFNGTTGSIVQDSTVTFDLVYYRNNPRFFDRTNNNYSFIDDKPNFGTGINNILVTRSSNISQDISNTVSLGTGTLMQSNQGIAIGRNALVYGNSESAISIGYNVSVQGDNPDSMSIGDNVSILANSKESVAMGSALLIGENSEGSVLIGSNSATGTGTLRSICIGYGSNINTNSTFNIGIGNNYQIFDNVADSIAIGRNAVIRENADRCIAIGEGANISPSTQNTIALGGNTVGNLSNGVFIGPRFLHMSNLTTPSPSLASSNGAFFVSGGKPIFTSGTAIYSGAVVTADSGVGNQTCGAASFSGGPITVNTTAVQSNSIILVNYNATPNNPPNPPASSDLGILSIGDVVPGTSFKIRSNDPGDNSRVNWLIINPT
jgi:hypothetical protein